MLAIFIYNKRRCTFLKDKVFLNISKMHKTIENYFTIINPYKSIFVNNYEAIPFNRSYLNRVITCLYRGSLTLITRK